MKTITVFVVSIIVLGNIASGWAESFRSDLEDKANARQEQLDAYE